MRDGKHGQLAAGSFLAAVWPRSLGAYRRMCSRNGQALARRDAIPRRPQSARNWKMAQDQFLFPGLSLHAGLLARGQVAVCSAWQSRPRGIPR